MSSTKVEYVGTSLTIFYGSNVAFILFLLALSIHKSNPLSYMMTIKVEYFYKKPNL
jgi:hypothetical protein